MRIKMRTLAAGPDGVLPIGLEVDLPDKVAQQYIDGGYAVPVKARRETASVSPPEAAVQSDLARALEIGPEVAQEMADLGITLETLSETDDKTLLAIPGIGKATLRKIREKSKEG